MASHRTFSGTITKTQLWSRKAMADLWAQREELLSSDEVKLLDRLYRSRKGTGVFQSQAIKYKTSTKSDIGKAGYGRLYGYEGFSLEQVSAEIRGTLCHDIYHDLDIVNCQPTLLSQLAASYGKTLSLLDLYTSRREAFLLELQSVMECGRDVAKQEILKVLYGGSTSIPILRSLSIEIRDFGLFLASTDEWSEIYGLAKSDNRVGSFIAAVLQTEERRCLMAMDDYMAAHGWHVDVLSYDGFMVRKRPGFPITEELLSQLAASVKEVVGYDVKIAEKPMTSLLPPVQEPVTSAADAAYATMKAEFEKNHFYFLPTDTVTEVTPEDGIRHFGLEHARNAFNTEEWTLEGTKDDETFIKRWMKDPKRRKIQRMVYKRQEDCNSMEASLFTGFAYERMTGEDPTAVPLFLDILGAVCGDEDPVLKYVVKWFAHIIQQPFEIPGTAIILTSHTHGTGKDTIANIIRKIIGRHAQHYGSETHFWDKHDTGKEGALFLHLEEAGAASNKAKADELKAMVTSSTMRVNPKGLRAYEVPNMARILMTTNAPDPLKLEETDRRFMLIRPSDRLHARGNDWWLSIQPQINSEAFLGTIGRWLWSYCLAGWNPRVMPMTDVKACLLEDSMPQAKRFLLAMAPADGEEPGFKTSKELMADYKRWAIEEGIDSSIMFRSPNSLGIALGVYKGSFVDKIHTERGKLYRYKKHTITPAGGAGSAE